jgi:cyclase
MTFAIQQISPSASAVFDERLVSNAGIIVLKDGIVLMDAGMRPDIARLLRNQLEGEFGHPVRYLCLTHYHADHSFSLKAFKDTTILASAEVVTNLKQSSDWTSQNLAAMKQRDPSGGEWVDEVEFCLPSLLFHDRLDILDQERSIELHHSGGHTSCSVYAYLPQEKVLFAGDLIFAGIFPYAGDPTCNPELWMKVLRLWLKLDIEYVVPGHGPLGKKELIKDQLAFFEALKSNTLSSISAGKGPKDIVIPAPFSVDENSRGFTEKTLNHWYTYYDQKNLTTGDTLSPEESPPISGKDRGG